MRKPGQDQRRPRNGFRTVPLPGRVVRRGFTLIELLVCMLIIVILVSLYWGGGPDRGTRGKKACAMNLGKIYVALETYATDHSGQFPVTPARTSEEALSVLVPVYTSDTSLFICPASKDEGLPAGESFRDKRISYAYCMGLSNTNNTEVLMADRLIDTLPKQAGDLIFSSDGKLPANNHKTFGGNFLFGDGDVRSSPAKASFSLVLPTGVVLLNPKP